MKVFKSRWFLLILGLLVGAYVGSDLALRYATSRKIRYDQVMEDHYIDSRLSTIVTSTATLAKAEKADLDGVSSVHKMMLRDAFLTLVGLHKTGQYRRKDADIRRELRRAKEFMAERPDQFVKQQFVTVPSPVKWTNRRDIFDNPENTKVTSQARERLEEAFDYVDAFPEPSH